MKIWVVDFCRKTEDFFYRNLTALQFRHSFEVKIYSSSHNWTLHLPTRVDGALSVSKCRITTETNDIVCCAIKKLMLTFQLSSLAFSWNTLMRWMRLAYNLSESSLQDIWRHGHNSSCWAAVQITFERLLLSPQKAESPVGRKRWLSSQFHFFILETNSKIFMCWDLWQPAMFTASFQMRSAPPCC